MNPCSFTSLAAHLARSASRLRAPSILQRFFSASPRRLPRPAQRIAAQALLVACAGSAALLPLHARAAPIDVTINVRGVRDTAGQVRVAAHADKGTFPSNWTSAAASAQARPEANVTAVRLRLPGPGSYAFIALHDANGNGSMDKNLVGIPKEGFGTTDGQRGLRIPRFAPAMLQITAPATLTIDMDYP